MDAINDSDGPSTAAAVVEPEKPSCHGCRKRKLKCSRELPTCAHCRRLDAECIYGDKKSKPGLKSGAIEGLSRRIESLENALFSRNAQESRYGDSPATNGNNTLGLLGNNPPEDVLNLLSTLCMELCKHNNSLRQSSDRPSGVSASPDIHRQQRQRQYSPSRDSTPPLLASHSRKRRRLDSCGNPNIDLQLPLEDVVDASPASSLPPPELLEDVVNVYFAVIQPWLPILHETRFRTRLNDPEQRASLLVIIHAMVVCTMRFAQPETHGLSSEQVEGMAKRSSSIVILKAMDSLAVENLQALIMIAFNDIGNGEASKAWSIVGSLTRTVEYLQLSVEPVNHDTEPLLKPLVSLPPAQSWVEEEERRRVFWNIFNLDRFCSVATGWNTSLTADDVKRRLPADGGCWHRGEVVTTPYFGIWDRSSAKIGNSIAFLPAHYSSLEQDDDPDAEPVAATKSATLPPQTSPRPSTTKSSVSGPDMSTVGAFAYCIEATESLSRVTTFFLQQRIDFNDRREVINWLTRFKELDLRLVHWKMFLPRKWKDSNVSRQPQRVEMDPNLTLAHATHNTSMILLHQRIAYPPAEWANIVKLPSLCSADTCQNAAIETQNITAKYLKYTSLVGPVTNQFAFCVFVAARVLLVHWRYYGSELPREFWQLVEGLDEMAKRWLGTGDGRSGFSAGGRERQRCLAETYADHLRDLHQRCVADANFSVDVLGYSTVISNHSAHHYQQAQPQKPRHRKVQTPQATSGSNGMVPLHHHYTNTSGAYFPQPQQAASHMVGSPSEVALVTATPTQQIEYESPTNDELSNISYMLLDQQFLDMDRVISLDNMMFSTGMGTTAHAMGDRNSSFAGSHGGDSYSFQ